MNDLILNFDKLHTTEMGVDRIKRNLNLDALDVVKWCYKKIVKQASFKILSYILNEYLK